MTIIQNLEQLSICTKCLLPQNISQFYTSKGRTYKTCKFCYSKSSKNYYRNNIPKYKKRNHKKENQIKLNTYKQTSEARWKLSLQKSAKRELNWEIPKAMYFDLIKNPCYYCNEITFNIEMGIGLDRLDSTKGYIIHNVVSCRKVCNHIKNKYSIEVLLKKLPGLLNKSVLLQVAIEDEQAS